MAVSFSALNNSVLTAFGETCTISVGAVDTSVTAVYFAPFEQYQLGEQLLTKPDHVVVMLTTVYAATNAVAGNYVTVRGTKMQIVGSESDEANMTAVSLREDLA